LFEVLSQQDSEQRRLGVLGRSSRRNKEMDLSSPIVPVSLIQIKAIQIHIDHVLPHQGSESFFEFEREVGHAVQEGFFAIT